MPAIRNLLTAERVTLQARRPESYHVKRPLSPTAIGFLVPLFVVFLFGPFLCIYLVKKRRGSQRPNYSLGGKAPTESREEARKRLDTVTEVSSLTGTGKSVCVSLGEEKDGQAETTSVLGRECAICLSTLHAPSPPEPVMIVDAATAKAPSVSDMSLAEKEEILRLKVCGHEFHAECLISWFHIRKYSCPICRAVYYEKEGVKRSSQELEMEERPESQNARHQNETNRGRDEV